MDTNERIHIEQLKRLKIFSKAYISKKSNENLNYSKKNSQVKINKRHKRRFSPDIKKMKKMKITNSPKKNNLQFKSTVSADTFNEKNQIYKNSRCKSQDKPIKINLVSQKFRIANDFNEKNSNQFLKEKDECLREVILSDKIEEEKPNRFFSEKKTILKLSTIKNYKFNNNLNKKQIKGKIILDDSEGSLSKLIEEIK